MIVCLSVSHKKASLPMLESLTFPDEESVTKAFFAEGIAQECIVLQTCHRVEIYSVTQDTAKENVVNRILRLWSARVGVSYDILSKVAELYEGKEALAHLFSLAAGLESMVVGEDQILGQVRMAYVRGKKLGKVGPMLDRTFMKAINTGRRIRTETRINEGSVSISSAAVDLAAKELGGLKSTSALIIGAGEAGSIAAETLRRRRTSSILVANRTYKKGQELASKISGKAIKFTNLYKVLPKVDLVIVAASVNKPILKAKEIKKTLTRNVRSKHLYVVDISQPRAVEEKVGLVQGVILRNIDDLKGIVEENLRNRECEVEKARKIVLEELKRFETQLSKLLVEPLVSKIYRRMEELRRRELERAIRKMKDSDERTRVIMDRFSRELVERIIQTPAEQLSEAVLDNKNELLSAAEKLFRIKNEKGEKLDEV
jgi:glutamyl-tRNA reductase